MHPAEDSAGFGAPAAIVSDMRGDQKPSSHFKVQEAAQSRGGRSGVW